MKPILTTLIEPIPASELNREQKIKQRGLLSQQTLAQQNRLYADTAGVSIHCRSAGFTPAFHDTQSGRSVISRYVDGRPAPLHLLDGLPADWVTDYDADGHVKAVRPGVIAGFLRAGRFYTREQAAKAA
ncbi:dihydroorotase [Sedimenticola sp.]|uniref:dihydroorotase n=1 Tax=Sedimenticola sp. TaxID=1940285 RepID=UPI003D0C795C